MYKMLVTMVMLVAATAMSGCADPKDGAQTDCVANYGWSDVKTANWLRQEGLVESQRYNVIVKKHTPPPCIAIPLAATLFPYSSARNELHDKPYSKSPGKSYTGKKTIESPSIEGVLCQLALLVYVGKDLTEEDLKQVVGNQPSRVVYTGKYNVTAEPCEV